MALPSLWAEIRSAKSAAGEVCVRTAALAADIRFILRKLWTRIWGLAKRQFPVTPFLRTWLRFDATGGSRSYLIPERLYFAAFNSRWSTQRVNFTLIRKSL